MNISGAEPVQCAACAYWDRYNNAVGVCRRHAPQPTAGGDTVAHWPETFAEEGCGEGASVTPQVALQPCAECLFWRQDSVSSGLEPVDLNDQPRGWWHRAGRCVRRAPVPLASPGARMVWPATSADDACAEGVPRNQAAAG